MCERCASTKKRELEQLADDARQAARKLESNYRRGYTPVGDETLTVRIEQVPGRPGQVRAVATSKDSGPVDIKLQAEIQQPLTPLTDHQKERLLEFLAGYYLENAHPESDGVFLTEELVERSAMADVNTLFQHIQDMYVIKRRAKRPKLRIPDMFLEYPKIKRPF